MCLLLLLLLLLLQNRRKKCVCQCSIILLKSEYSDLCCNYLNFFVNKSYHTVTLHFMVGPMKHEFFQSRVIPQYSVCCGGEIQRHSCYSFIDIWHLLLVTYMYWGCKSSRKLSFPLPCFSPKFIFETTEHQEGAVAEGSRDFSGIFVF